MNETNSTFNVSQVSAHSLWSTGLLGWSFIVSAAAHAGLLIVLSQTPFRSSLDAGPTPELRLGDHAMQVMLTSRHVEAPEPTAEIPINDLLAPLPHVPIEDLRGISDQITPIVEIVVSPNPQLAHDSSQLLSPMVQEAQPHNESQIVLQESAASPHDVAMPLAPRVDTPRATSEADLQVDQAEASDESTAGVQSGARIENLPAVRYPLVSRRRGEEGLVVLRVQVRADGSAGRITLIRDAGHRRLRAAAIDAVRRARFRPAVKSGRAIESDVIVPIRFRLGEHDDDS